MYYIVDGRRWWSRPVLLAYWGLLALISVAGWSRQLTRSRRNRSWVTTTSGPSGHRVAVKSDSRGSSTAQNGVAAGVGGGGNAASASGPTASPIPNGSVDGFSQVATQMMDAADLRLPTLSVNARRKYFHGLAVVMFVPGILVDVSRVAVAVAAVIRPRPTDC
jgi:hypothetical protein